MNYQISDWESYQLYKSGKNIPKKAKWIKFPTNEADDYRLKILVPEARGFLIYLLVEATKSNGKLPNMEQMMLDTYARDEGYIHYLLRQLEQGQWIERCDDE